MLGLAEQPGSRGARESLLDTNSLPNLRFCLATLSYRPITRRINGFFALRAAFAVSQPYLYPRPLLLLRRAAPPRTLSPHRSRTFSQLMPPVILAFSLSSRVSSGLEILFVLMSLIVESVATQGFFWLWRIFQQYAVQWGEVKRAEWSFNGTVLSSWQNNFFKDDTNLKHENRSFWKTLTGQVMGLPVRQDSWSTIARMKSGIPCSFLCSEANNLLHARRIGFSYML